MPRSSNVPIILCVDDDSIGLRFRQLMLETKGYKVLLASSPQQGMEVFSSSPVDLVVTDHLLGRAMGTNMAAAMKQLKADVPILILSGSSSPPEGTESADAYLCKSEGPEALLNRVSALLASSAEERITERRQAEHRVAADLVAADLEAMTRLHQLGVRSIQPGVQFEEILGEIVEAALAITGADKGNLQLLDMPSGVLKIAAHRGFEDPFLKFFAAVRNEAAACTAAMQCGERVVVEDVTRSPIFAGTPSLAVLREAGVRAVQSTPLLSSAGNVVGMISTHFGQPHRFSERDLRLIDLLARQSADFVERKRAEQEQAQLAAIVESSDDAIISKTLDGVVLTWNKAAECMYGYHAEEIVGKPASILLPSDRIQEEEQILSQIRRGEKVPLHDSLRVAKGGRMLHVGVVISPIRDSDGNIIGASTIARDRTQLKMAEQALRDAEKLVIAGRMAATVAHEINGPLEAVANILFLLERAELGHTNHEFVRAAQEEVKRIGQITKLTLGFHREGEDRRATEVRATELIDGILTLYGHRIESQGVKIEKRYDSAGSVTANAGELRQVLSNLIVNATEALAKTGSKLLIHVYDSPDWRNAGREGVRIVIADDGSGISREVRHRLFEPFFTTKGEKGTGLGLWVSRSLMEKHGGRLQVRSAPGVGTAFSVFLPASMAAKVEVA